jgi:uncharacterized membrane protein YphA (DoxX/SURF4 family)
MPRSVIPISSRWRAVGGCWPVSWAIAVAALLVRVYLAWLWFQFGITKLDAGWLTHDPVRGLLTLVAGGQTPMPIPGLSIVAGALLAVHADVLLSVILPFVELALAVSFLTGYYVRSAALVGIAVNASLILGGLASVSFDGRIIVLQALLLLASQRASALRVPRLPQVIHLV